MSDGTSGPASFRAGFAQVDITPPVGSSLAGYFHDRVATRVRDPLHAKAMVLDSDGTRLALVACDLICVDRDTTGPAKDLILRQTGIAPECVLACATHTHTGPEIRVSTAHIPVDKDYVARLPGLLADAVAQAQEAMVPVTLRPGRAQCEGYSFNRLFRLKDGSEVFGASGREEQIITEAGPIDPELQTLSAVDQEGRLRGMVVNFALHPDVIGGGSADFISADWPGEIGRNVAAVYGEDVVTLFLQGTCGDINHRIHRPTFLPTGGEAKAVQIGRGLAGVAMYAAEQAEPMTAAESAVAGRVLDIPYYTRTPELRAEIERMKAKGELSASERYLIARTEKWPHDNEIAQVPIQVLRIGDVAVVGLPAEIFVRIGLDIKHWSPAKHTLVVELANERVSGYVPSTDQAGRGAYGAKPILSRWLSEDAGRRMADAAVVMLHELW